MYNSMKWWQRGSESSQHSPAYCLWNTLEWRSLANSHWKNSFQRTVFTDYLHCLFRLYIFQVNTMWSLCMKDFFQRKILGQLACCFFLNSLEALMQISPKWLGTCPSLHRPPPPPPLEFRNTFRWFDPGFPLHKQEMAQTAHLLSPSRSWCSQRAGSFLPSIG